MTVYDLIRDFWGALLAAAGWLVWMVRLEAKAVANAAEVRRLWRQRREDLEEAKRTRAEDLAAAARARKESADMLAEIRSDVKLLLGRNR